MVQANDSFGIDQDIPSALKDVASRVVGPPPSQEQSGVCLHRCRSENVPPTRVLHPIGGVERPRLIDQQRPRDVSFADVGAGDWPRIECHDRDLDSQMVELGFLLPQLRQMFAAGESAQMTMEHQQEPASGVLLEPINGSFGVRQRERDRGLADSAAHSFCQFLSVAGSLRDPNR